MELARLRNIVLLIPAIVALVTHEIRGVMIWHLSWMHYMGSPENRIKLPLPNNLTHYIP